MILYICEDNYKRNYINGKNAILSSSGEEVKKAFDEIDSRTFIKEGNNDNLFLGYNIK